MGSTYSYTTKAGKRWEARYRRPDGKPARKGGFLRKRDAEDYLVSVENSKLTGSYIAPKLGRITIRELSENWLKSAQATTEPSNFRSTKSSWRTHVEPQWGNRKIDEIRRSEVKSWVAELASKRSATIVKRAHGVLAGILEDAVADRRILENPARGVKTPKKPLGVHSYLTHEQVETLAAEAKHSDLVRFLAYTGLRWGEAIDLAVSDVNTQQRSVHVHSKAVLLDAEIVIGSPKTHEIRVVHYPAFLDDAIAQAMDGKSGTELLWGDGVNHLRTSNSKSGWFAGAVKRCMTRDASFPRVTPHDLRHTAASLAISAGANVKAVQRMLGHASAAMTLDTYADLFPSDLESVAVALDDARQVALGGNAAVTG